MTGFEYTKQWDNLYPGLTSIEKYCSEKAVVKTPISIIEVHLYLLMCLILIDKYYLVLRWHLILRKFIIIFLCYSFNLTVAKELTPNPGGVYN